MGVLRGRWTAPDAPGDTVVAHVAANAANNDASPFGDDAYTATVQARLRSE